MSFDQIIMWIMAVGILIGGLDKIFGNKFGLGEKFDEGFNAMGPLALGMVGIVCLAPVISKLLGPVIIPMFTAIGVHGKPFLPAYNPHGRGKYPCGIIRWAVYTQFHRSNR